MQTTRSSACAWPRLIARTAKIVLRAAPGLSAALFACLVVQAIVPVAIVTTIARLIDAVPSSLGWGSILPRMAPMVLALALDAAVGPLVLTLQGELTDRITAAMNDNLHAAICRINTLAVLDDPKAYHTLELLQQEIAYRPVNLLIYGMSLFRMSLTLGIAFVQLASYSLLVPVVLFACMAPQSVVLYRLQVEAFENTVFRSPLARRLHYFSEVLLRRSYAQERLVYRFGDAVRKKYNDTFAEIYRASRRDRRRMTAAGEWIALGSIAALALLVAYFFHKVAAGVFTMGALALFLQYVRLAGTSSFQFVQEGALLVDTMLFMRHYFSFVDEDRNLGEGVRRLTRIESITWEDVSFTYPGRDHPALLHISFSIRAPQKVALVGVNGSGKSTMLKLMLRLYDPDEGRILINGIPAAEYVLDDVRRAFGVLFQDFGRFSWSLEENITLARPGEAIAQDDLADAMHGAGADAVACELPAGASTPLGKLYDDGVELSGGQWQKVATARALYRDGSARLFDEPSSALDPISEKALWEKLLSWSDGKLSIFTSHRLRGLQSADVFLVLERGRLVESGTFREVYDAGGVFRALYDAQAGEGDR